MHNNKNFTHRFLPAFIASLSSTAAWIGGAFFEGSWRWATGPEAGGSISYREHVTADYPFNAWNGGEPNGDGGEPVIIFNYGPSHLWNDTTPNQNFLYVTEFDAPVPEPTVWIMMVGGFGTVGGTIRRRRMLSAVG